ncbi:pyrroloquinoline quinone biosynthesis protein PqqF [Stutzerimonas zhaodongensis]|uniref:pyrroloquinoline quinone biosynthesis protein PqqF n=1 Tax=Stutzerimonas TaxID=2901164 RepID=UPI00388D9800
MHSSFDPVQRPSQTVLTNGLRVRLLSVPRGVNAAALVRVHAGSHDAPGAYPGLAHFLEHLLFLGSRDFPAAQSLMPFVQGCGGQVNASTRERHTDFFFQVPSSQFEEGFLRLIDLLANPLLDRDAQQREREVLHAEFLARAKDVETLCDAAFGQVTDLAHPFSGFHAGNRETLPVEDDAFQHSLLGYHKCFYHAGQIELLLAGPVQGDALLRLAERMDDGLAANPHVARKPPPLRWKNNDWLRLHLADANPRLLMAFVLDGLPDATPAALDYLSVWLASEAPGGLIQRLREAELCQSVRLRIPYWYAGQGVAVIELLPTERGLGARATLVGAVLDWLRFFSERTHWQLCREEYRRVRQRSLHSAEPLLRLRYWVDPVAWSPDSDEAAVEQALGVLARSMLESGPLVLTTDKTERPALENNGFPLSLQAETPQQTDSGGWIWAQPTPNPWLAPDISHYEAARVPSAIRWHGATEPDGLGVLFLQWRFMHGQPSPAVWHSLAHASKSIAWAAEQAGVMLRFEDMGRAWTLCLSGFAEAIPAILSDLLQRFSEPPRSAFIQGEALAQQEASLGSDEMLIRQLFRRLPRLLAQLPSVERQSTKSDQAMLAGLWESSKWHGLAIGFPESLSGPLFETTRAWPGTPVSTPLVDDIGQTGKRWHYVGGGADGAETALLLFCPLPERTAECEAAWRVLARMIEPDFFQRLRSELQLGYAVFSRYCQFGSHAGVVFGVQSPTASAGQILEHVESFLLAASEKLAKQPVEAVQCAAQQAGDRHVASPADIRTHAEQAWQSLLAGHVMDRPVKVAAAMRGLHRHDLTAALAALREASRGWVVVANAPAPDATWAQASRALSKL